MFTYGARSAVCGRRAWYHASGDKAGGSWGQEWREGCSWVVSNGAPGVGAWLAVPAPGGYLPLLDDLVFGQWDRASVTAKRCCAGGDAQHEAYVPTEPHPAPEITWLPGPHEEQGRAGDHQAAAREGPQAARRHDSLQVGRGLATPRGGLPRSHRLLRSQDFERVARNGWRSASGKFVVIVSPQQRHLTEGRARLGITASRRAGSAVVRSHVKRQVREWFRAERWEIEPVDILVIVRPAGARLSSCELRRELSCLTRHALSKESGVKGE